MTSLRTDCSSMASLCWINSSSPCVPSPSGHLILTRRSVLLIQRMKVPVNRPPSACAAHSSPHRSASTEILVSPFFARLSRNCTSECSRMGCGAIVVDNFPGFHFSYSKTHWNSKHPTLSANLTGFQCSPHAALSRSPSSSANGPAVRENDRRKVVVVTTIL